MRVVVSIGSTVWSLDTSLFMVDIARLLYVRGVDTLEAFVEMCTGKSNKCAVCEARCVCFLLDFQSICWLPHISRTRPSKKNNRQKAAPDYEHRDSRWASVGCMSKTFYRRQSVLYLHRRSWARM